MQEPERIIISVHAVQRFRERKRWLGVTPVDGLSDAEEIRLLLVFAEPCHGIPEDILRARAEKHGGPATYVHAGAWRLVINHRNVLCTVEPDIHEGDPGIWREIEEALGHSHRSGFTVAEITRGKIKKVAQKGGVFGD